VESDILVRNFIIIEDDEEDLKSLNSLRRCFNWPPFVVLRSTETESDRCPGLTTFDSMCMCFEATGRPTRYYTIQLSNDSYLASKYIVTYLLANLHLARFLQLSVVLKTLLLNHPVLCDTVYSDATRPTVCSVLSFITNYIQIFSFLLCQHFNFYLHRTRVNVFSLLSSAVL